MNPERNRETNEIQEFNQPTQKEITEREKEDIQHDLEANPPTLDHEGERKQVEGEPDTENQSSQNINELSSINDINNDFDIEDINSLKDMHVNYDAQNDVGDGNSFEAVTEGNGDISIDTNELALTDSDNVIGETPEQNGDTFDETSDQNSDNDIDMQKIKHEFTYFKNLANTFIKMGESLSAQIDAIKEAREQGLQTNEDGIVIDSGLSKMLDVKDKFEEALEKEEVPKYKESLKELAQDTFGRVGEAIANKYNDFIDSIGKKEPDLDQTDVKAKTQEEVTKQDTAAESNNEEMY